MVGPKDGGFGFDQSKKYSDVENLEQICVQCQAGQHKKCLAKSKQQQNCECEYCIIYGWIFSNILVDLIWHREHFISQYENNTIWVIQTKMNPPLKEKSFRSIWKILTWILGITFTKCMWIPLLGAKKRQKIRFNLFWRILFTVVIG